MFTHIYTMFEAKLIGYFLLGTFTQTHFKNRECFVQKNKEISGKFYNSATSLSSAMIVFVSFSGPSKHGFR